MRRPRNARLSLLALLALFAAGCSRGAGGAGGTAKPAVAVDAAPVVSGDLKEAIEVVGTLAPKFQAEVKTEYSGTVTEVLVTEWVRVAKGTVLLRFDAREAEAAAAAAKANFLAAEVGMNRARRELERTLKLKEAGLATPQALDDARTSSEAAEAQLAAATAQQRMAETKLEKTVIRSPLDGVVASRTVNPGDYIENMGSPRPMFRIVDNRRLDLTVTVPSSRISGVSLGQPLSFTTDAVPGRTFTGKVSFINPAADESSRTVKVVAVVDNPDEALKSGLFAKGEIVTGERKNVLRVPRSAFVTWDLAARSAVVFVVEGERAVRKSVETGANAGDDVEVTRGLSAGERVVTRGAFNLSDGDRVSVVAPKRA
ncbi:MAG TPA: efflux RND transporter periplasmic adaptor subunit [Thermoanaerobaculia bacterium]|nr:efflux RND transporter periplasmic adaptor subunit [Thermoanaerobaculia bacterium]HQR65913.1 efflux RND transporter periplasmic adaptor subunit [Thermoanaerobaculia bacterium]